MGQRQVKPTARTVAATVLVRVERDGAFAAAALDAELDRAAQLEPRDRALATELVYGALRVLPWLSARVERHAPRGIGKMEPHARAHVLLGAYQLFFLSRVPPFAAVNEAVDAATARTGKKVGAFTNAVLRKVQADAAREPASFVEAVVASTAPWLMQALVRALGEEGARAFVASSAEVPPIGLRVEAKERAAWIERLRQASASGGRAAASFEPGAVSPRAILARGAGQVERLPGYAEGAWTVQEEGSQVVALALGARRGDAVLDACAGRGNKASLLARAVQPRGAVDACDLHEAKLLRLRAELGRMGLFPRATFAVDWRAGSGGVSGVYDRVLVDAPCTGVGTLRRRPDLATRRAPEDILAAAEAEGTIAARAAEHVKPGGRLVYAVCSVLREEAEDVVATLLSRAPFLRPAPFDAPEARVLEGAPTLRLLPHVHGTDGYFLASFVRSV
jgi:16S rRNA (cytosine967-C5)-methyltransferase